MVGSIYLEVVSHEFLSFTEWQSAVWLCVYEDALRH